MLLPVPTSVAHTVGLPGPACSTAHLLFLVVIRGTGIYKRWGLLPQLGGPFTDSLSWALFMVLSLNFSP